MSYLNGVAGQINGNFAAEQELIDIIKEKHGLDAFYGLKKIGILATQGDIICIDGQDIIISRSGVYELDHVKYIKSLKFKNNVENVIIDYVY